MTISSAGGQPQEVREWSRRQPPYYGRAAWTSDSRNLICLMSDKSVSGEALDWFVFPLDGSPAQSMRAAEELRAAGVGLGSAPMLVTAGLILSSGKQAGGGLFEVKVTPGRWRIRGAPRQLTSGTQSDAPYSATANGTIALEVSDAAVDLYLLPLSRSTGQASGVVQQLTHDQREKQYHESGGNVDSDYFYIPIRENRSTIWRYYAIDLVTGKQTEAFHSIPLGGTNVTISPDGGMAAYSLTEAQSSSIRLIAAGSNAPPPRVLCQFCGEPVQFSPQMGSIS